MIERGEMKRRDSYDGGGRNHLLVDLEVSMEELRPTGVVEDG